MTARGSGNYRANEVHVATMGRFWAAGGPLVVQVPGVGGTGDAFLSPTYDDEPRAVAARGACVMGITEGSRWGNADMDTSIDSAITYAGATWGADTDPVRLIGGSGGAAAVLNWARTHVAAVARIALIIPAVDVEDIRANNRSGLAAGIETAYTNNATWQATRTTRNPVEHAATLAAIPIRIWYSTDDPICVPATITAFAAAHGNTTLTSLGAIGHASTGINPAEFAAFLTA